MQACFQDADRVPQTVISADVIFTAGNEEYSSRQRDICSESLVFPAFFFTVMDSWFLYLLLHVCQSVHAL